MANTNNQNTLLVGAALAGLLGTLTKLLAPKRRSWAQHAKLMADRVMSHRMHQAKRETNRHLLLSGVAGSLVGITTAILLAPKPGSELLRDLSKSFQPHETRARSRHSRTSHSTGSKKTHHATKHHAVNHSGSKSSVAAKKKTSTAKKRAAPKKKNGTAAKAEGHHAS